MKRKKLPIIIVVTIMVISCIFIFSDILSINEKILKIFTEEIISSNEETLAEIDLNKIKELQQIKNSLTKDQEYMTYDEVISNLGEGVIAYPIADNKAVKVAYWNFKYNGYEYFLDTIFFNDNFINMESRLVEFPNYFQDSNIENFNELKDQVYNITSLSQLKGVVGKGVKVMQYYTAENQAIYAWSYEDGFLVAYTSNGDDIVYLKTAKTLQEVVISSANCH